MRPFFGYYPMALLSSYTPDLVEAGLDEAGRGCLAGPVIAAFVILPKDYFHPLIDDSKKLNRASRDILEKEILREAIDYGIGEVCNKEIDKINILNASFLAMHRALDKSKVAADILLIDGNRFKTYKAVPHKCIIAGDAQYLSIAAASILAKTHRDRIMYDLAREYPHYGWETNAAYATRKHREAILEKGITPYHRISFTLNSSQLKLFAESDC